MRLSISRDLALAFHVVIVDQQHSYFNLMQTGAASLKFTAGVDLSCPVIIRVSVNHKYLAHENIFVLTLNVKCWPKFILILHHTI